MRKTSLQGITVAGGPANSLDLPAIRKVAEPVVALLLAPSLTAENAEDLLAAEVQSRDIGAIPRLRAVPRPDLATSRSAAH
jgi:hypothetical protein